MTASEIVEAEMRRRMIGPKDFFGTTKLAHIVAARRAAILALDQAGFDLRDITKVMRRERTSILYNLRPEMRANHRAYFAVYSAKHRPPPRAGCMGKDKRRKLTAEQQQEVLGLYLAERFEETHAMERRLGVCRGYARKLGYRLERQEEARARPTVAVQRTANSPLWARAIERGSISI